MAGAGVAALLMPATIALTSIGVALGWIDENGLWKLLSSPWVRAYLFVVLFLSLFHAAHRLRFVLVDLGLKAVQGLVAVVCYGSAIVGTVFAALLTLRVWP
jgi:fumarate reductase subunit D